MFPGAKHATGEAGTEIVELAGWQHTCSQVQPGAWIPHHYPQSTRSCNRVAIRGGNSAKRRSHQYLARKLSTPRETH